MNRHTPIITSIVLAILCGAAVLVAVGVWLDRRAYDRALPPKVIEDFDSFVEWRASVSGFELIHRETGDHLLARADGGRLVSVSSGYVFDRAGRLVDWTADTSDDRRFQEKWLPSSKSVTLKEARAWIDSGRAASGE